MASEIDHELNMTNVIQERRHNRAIGGDEGNVEDKPGGRRPGKHRASWSPASALSFTGWCRCIVDVLLSSR